MTLEKLLAEMRKGAYKERGWEPRFEFTLSDEECLKLLKEHDLEVALEALR